MKPLIAVTPLYDRERDSLWMLPGYFDRVLQAGGVPCALPLTGDEEALAAAAETFDGFLFTGGQDVDPALYGAVKQPCTEEICPERDRMESVLLQKVLEKRKPVLGICRGLQFMNSYFGGTLYQDLSRMGEGVLRHRQDRPYTIASHGVAVAAGTPLRECLGADQIAVNSCHHQGIEHLAPGLVPMALSPDGLIEAFCHPGYPFVWAVQWHPEMMAEGDQPSRDIFKAFVEACGKSE